MRPVTSSAVLAWCIVLVLGGSVGGAAVLDTSARRTAAPAPVGALPPKTVLQRVLHPAPPRPAYLLGTSDAVFGSTVTRVSDQRAFGTSAPVLRPGHPRLQPWNADGSRLLLGLGDPGYLLDGASYAYRGERLPRASVGVWSNVDPDGFYSVDGNRLVRVSAGTGRLDLVHEFVGATGISLGNGEGSPSNDDRTVVVVTRAPGRTSLVVYDLVRRAVVATLELPAGSDRRLAWAAASQSGDHVVVSWFDDGPLTGSGVDLYDRSLRYERHLYPVSETADLGVDSGGQDVLVTFDPALGKRDGDQLPVLTVRLADGAVTEQLRLDWVGSSISCRNTDRPGWCYLSDGAVDAPRARTGGFDEVYSVRLDGSRTVERFAHAQQSRGAASEWTTLAVPSRDGTRVVWGSDWRMGVRAPAYAYVASYRGGQP